MNYFLENRWFFIKLEKWSLDLFPFDYTKNKLKKILTEILIGLGLENEKLDFKNTFLDLSWAFNSQFCLNNSRIPTEKSLKTETWYNLYDLRIKLHFRPENKKYLNYLTNRV